MAVRMVKDGFIVVGRTRVYPTRGKARQAEQAIRAARAKRMR